MSKLALCRMCARPTAADCLHPLFTRPESYERHALALKLATGLQIQRNDGLPQQICTECSLEINQVLLFRAKSQRAQTRLFELGYRKKNKTYRMRQSSTLKKELEQEKKFMSRKILVVRRKNLNSDKKKLVLQEKNSIKKELVDQENNLNSVKKEQKNWDSDKKEVVVLKGNSDSDMKEFTVKEDHLNSDEELVDQENNSEECVDEWDHDDFDSLGGLSYIKGDNFSNTEGMKRKKSNRPSRAQWMEAKTREYHRKMDKYLNTSAPLYTCKECKRIYKTKSTFGSHLVVHTGMVMCDRCGKTFRNRMTMVRHQRTVHGAPRVKCLRCPHCDFWGLDPFDLKEHDRKHTGEKPYICDTCSAGFPTKPRLIQHLSVHMTEKNVLCKQCPSRFKTRHDLNVHRYRLHKPRRWRYRCAYCPNTYMTSFNCRTHMRKFHGLPTDQQEKPIHVPFVKA